MSRWTTHSRGSGTRLAPNPHEAGPAKRGSKWGRAQGRSRRERGGKPVVGQGDRERCGVRQETRQLTMRAGDSPPHAALAAGPVAAAIRGPRGCIGDGAYARLCRGQAMAASVNETRRKATPPDCFLRLWREMLRTQKLHNGQTPSFPHPGKRKPGHCDYSPRPLPRPPPRSLALAANSSAASLAPTVAVKEDPILCEWGRYSGWHLLARGLTPPGGIDLPKRPLPPPILDPERDPGGMSSRSILSSAYTFLSLPVLPRCAPARPYRWGSCGEQPSIPLHRL